MGTITVLRAGPLTTVQDLGRPEQRHIGIAPGGALDLHAARIANLLVGNAEESALLEITLGPSRFRLSDERIAAWCGGDYPAEVNGKEFPPGRAARVPAEGELIMRAPRRGCRAWIALSGGIDLPRLLDSRATDLRGQFGGFNGRALRDGDELLLGEFPRDAVPFAEVATWGAPAEWARTALQHPVLRVLQGAEWQTFSPETQAAFRETPFTVDRQADRMGARLKGPQLFREHEEELISEAVVPGTIQVANDHQPILLLGGCQTIGGYPKIAHVITVDLPFAAQLAPNDSVRFQFVSPEEARELFLVRAADLERFRVGLRLRSS